MRKIILAFVFIYVGLVCLSSNAIADLIIAEGKPTGQWYNPSRDGEGFYVEVFNIGGNPHLGLAMFTYDENGEQMWITGAAPVDSDDVVMTVPMFLTDGPTWGSGYDMSDLNTTEFGTVTARFTSCNTALFQVRNNVGFENGDYPTVRLTEIVGSECTDPPPSNPDGVQTGKWVAEGVCLFVAEDGKTLTSENSNCPFNASVWLNIVGTELDYDGIANQCIVDVTCLGDWSIGAEDGYFSCVGEQGLIEGRFTSTTSVHGNAVQIVAGEGELGKVCITSWTASPE